MCDIMNHTSERSLNWKPPLQVLTGQTIDISILLQFLFWDIVYVLRYDDHQYHGQIGSKKSSEIRGRFVGFAWNVGHALTFKVLTDDSNKVICRSRVRLSKEGENNLKLDSMQEARNSKQFVKSTRDQHEDVILPTMEAFDSPFDIDEGENIDNSNLLQDAQEPTLEEIQLSAIQDDMKTKGRSEGEAIEFVEPLNTPNATIKGLKPEDMPGRTILMPPSEDGTRVRAKIL